MVLLRKELAGSTSHGHEWSEDGAVLDVPQDHANELLGIQDGGFSEVVEEDQSSVDEAPAPRRRGRGKSDEDEPAGDQSEVTE
ncbi:MAG: hypothetical protein JWO67_3197 [Streptosporangiaceae bacterium]|nr:hypothetical protein [Streptosporangiaceae bacterium]